MLEQVQQPSPPRGFARFAFRAPIWLYEHGLGWLLGDRFLQVTHTGRKSGLPRRTVLEVVRHDRASGVFYVASGWGERSDWYRNVLADPRVTIRAGRRHFAAVAERLAPAAAETELLDYWRRHPTALHEIARFMGYRIDDTEADVRALGRLVPVIAFRPR